MSGIAYLTRARGYKRAQITRLHSKGNDNLSSMSVNERTACVSNLEQLSTEVKVLVSKIIEFSH